MEIVRQIDDVDFGIMEKVNRDGTMVKVKTCHGTILMVKGLVEGEPDTLLPFGIPDGETEGHLALFTEVEE